jgi:hypothetical protein
VTITSSEQQNPVLKKMSMMAIHSNRLQKAKDTSVQLTFKYPVPKAEENSIDVDWLNE